MIEPVYIALLKLLLKSVVLFPININKELVKYAIYATHNNAV